MPVSNGDSTKLNKGEGLNPWADASGDRRENRPLLDSDSWVTKAEIKNIPNRSASEEMMARGKGKQWRKPRNPPQHKFSTKQSLRTVRETVDVVSYVTGEPRSRVNQFARRLIDDGILPKSSGRDIKRVGPEAAALLIFVIAHAKRTADASSTAKDFAQLTARFSEDGRGKDASKLLGIEPGSSLIEALVDLLASHNECKCDLDISRDAKGLASAEIIIELEEGTDTEVQTVIVPFLNEESLSATRRTYRLTSIGFVFLRTLMSVDNLPAHPADSPNFMGTAKYGGRYG